MVNTTASQSRARRMDLAFCPMCTHTVETEVVWNGRRWIVKPGQKCGRCHSPLDAGRVIDRNQAA
jgi:hypothetical protein